MPRLPIEVINAAVPGRLRFRLPGLYRAPALCQAVEQRVAALHGFRTVRANTLTGHVLVTFADPLPLDQLLSRLGQALGDLVPDVAVPTATARTAKAAEPTPTPRTGPVSTGEPWHARPLEAVLARAGVDPSHGLDEDTVLQRLAEFGPNSLSKAEVRSALSIILKQFQTVPVAMLGVSAVIAVATGGIADAGVILGVVVINAAIGYATEQQAERTIAALSQSGPRHAQLVRAGKVSRIPVEDIVPGDVLLLSPGSQVPADARLVQARRLTIDESALTGESLPVTKRVVDELAEDTPLGDRRNMSYMGTLVTGGSGVGVVLATGSSTELGQIQSLVDSTKPPETPMERQLDSLGTQLGLLSGAVCAGVFVVGLLRGQPMLQMLNAAVSLAVAAVPEGLPAVATTTLALGIKRMRERKVAVRQLGAVETLGSLQVLCLDKTGTLTANHMTTVATHYQGKHLAVRDGRVMLDDDTPLPLPDDGLSRMLQVVSLCSEVQPRGEDELEGSPTEIALVELAITNGIELAALRHEFPRLELRERAEGRPLMSSVHRAPSGQRLITVKGSPAETLQRCSHHWLHGKPEPLDDDTRRAILAANEHMAARALRVLGTAYRFTDQDGDHDAEGLVWLGLLGMQDPLRPGMAELMASYHAAGIKTVMITGDQSATAGAIGRELGLSGNGSLEILDSSRLDQLDPDLLKGLVGRVDVFSRVSPAHKLQIVQALQSSGRVVAMTGDGINDGPALKASDIGIALGASGTEVARSVADVVIEDDNLHTMSEAVRQGRTIYTNIRKTVHYLLSTNFSEIEVMFTAIALGLGQPLNPMQLLWINLVTDIFPGLALSMEPAGSDVMQQQPRPANEPLISRDKLLRMAGESGFITAGALGAFLAGRAAGGQAHGSSLAFHTLTIAQLLHANVCRDDHHGLFNPADRPRNPALDLALGGTAVAHLATLLLPGMRRLLGTTPLGLADLGIIAAGAGLPLLANEAMKAARQARSEPPPPQATQENS